MGDPQVLSGGNMAPVTRIGDRVERLAGEWSPAVHRLLRHCHQHGLGGKIPVPLRLEETREVLSFLDGEVPTYPLPSWVWSEPALRSAAELMADFMPSLLT